MAFLEGQAAIRYPVEASASSPGNAFFQDVLPVVSSDGGHAPGSLPAVAGDRPDAVRRRLGPRRRRPAHLRHPRRDRRRDRVVGARPAADPDLGPVAITVFFGFGTVFWYAAQLGTTWYQAHVLAVGLALLAIGVAIGGDRDAAATKMRSTTGATGATASRCQTPSRPPRSPAHARSLAPDPRQFLAGVLFGLACTSRLTVVFARRSSCSSARAARGNGAACRPALGAGIPVALLVVYNVVTTGHLDPSRLPVPLRLEAGFYSRSTTTWPGRSRIPAICPRISRSCSSTRRCSLPTSCPAGAGHGRTAVHEPGAVRGLFNRDCPLAAAEGHGHEHPADEPGLPPRPAGPPLGLRPQPARDRCACSRSSSSRSSTSCTSARAGSSSATASATTSCRGRCSSSRSGWSGSRASGRPLVGSAAVWRGPGRRVGRDQPLGRRLGRRAGLVTLRPGRPTVAADSGRACGSRRGSARSASALIALGACSGG